jgi:hypothetical protein
LFSGIFVVVLPTVVRYEPLERETSARTLGCAAGASRQLMGRRSPIEP